MAASDGKAEITTRDPRALEREVEARRAQLAGTIDELTSRLAPAAIAQRSLTSARGKVEGFAFDHRGGLRVERVVAVGVAVLGVTAFVVVRAVRRRR
ncbi:DUF3618 domain-containing protein [Kineococcus aurantiacus]|uniref:DUF3618 domain-containing protein n=1 Tax=Kineococcus aurantiacus TaxID=37633 RepID=A0A7Y9J1V8_9ACTN|nr:hypothetical protein [Kineococcus aurantiacus]